MEKLLKQVRKYVEPIQTNDQQIAFKVLKFFERRLFNALKNGLKLSPF